MVIGSSPLRKYPQTTIARVLFGGRWKIRLHPFARKQLTDCGFPAVASNLMLPTRLRYLDPPHLMPTLRVPIHGAAKWLFLENIGRLLQQLALISLTSHLGKADDLAAFAFAISIVTPLQMFAALQLRTLAASECSTPRNYWLYIAARILASAALVAASWLFSLFAGLSTKTQAITALWALVRSVELVSDLVWGFMHGTGNADRVAISALVRSMLGICLFAGLLRSGFSLFQALVVGAAFPAFATLAFDGGWLIRARRSGPLQCREPWNATSGSDIRSLMQFFVYATPFAIASMLGSLIHVGPRFWLREVDIGEFVAISAIFAGLTLAVGVLGQANLPTFAMLYKQSRYNELIKRYRTLTIISAVTGIVILLLALFIGREMLIVGFGHSVASHYISATILAAGTVFSFPLVQSQWLMLASRMIRSILFVNVVGLIVVTPLAMWLIPIFGTNGAAAVSVCANAVMLFVAALLIHRQT